MKCGIMKDKGSLLIHINSFLKTPLTPITLIDEHNLLIIAK